MPGWQSAATLQMKDKRMGGDTIKKYPVNRGRDRGFNIAESG